MAFGTRPQIERLMRLRELLRAGGGHAQALADELEVSERTIRRDLEFAHDRFDWPVRFDRRRRRWVLEGDPPSLPAIAMRPGELMAIAVAARAMESYRGTPYAAALQSGFDKILAALDAPAGMALPVTEPLPVFHLDPARELDPDLYARLFAACEKRKQLELTYHTQSRDETNVRRVDPYRLLNHGGDWYLIGYCHLRERVTDFAAGERMLSVRETGETFQPDPAFDLDEYLASGFGIFKGGPVEEVVLRFTPRQARYMRERVWAEDETKENLPGGGLLLRMRVPVNEGLLRFVLQYGAEVEVLAPEALREQVIETHRRALEPHGDTGRPQNDLGAEQLPRPSGGEFR
jgi:predicted DNA-binding transcriptional regulator YafY